MSVSSGPTELDTIAAGGENFLARMREFQSAKSQAESALNDLALGRSVKAAWDEAASKAKEAEQMLADAKAKVEQMLTSAQEQSQLIIEGAKSKIQSENEANAAMAADLKTQLAQIPVKIDEATKDAKTAAAESRKATIEAKKAADEAKKAAQESEAAHQLYVESKTKYDELYAKIKAVTAEVPSEG